MQTSYATMQCNGKLYIVHDILSLFCEFDFDLIFSAITIFIFELVFIIICTRQLGVCSHCYHLLNADVECQNLVFFFAKCVFYFSFVGQNFPFELPVVKVFYNILWFFENKNLGATYNPATCSITSVYLAMYE